MRSPRFDFRLYSIGNRLELLGLIGSMEASASSLFNVLRRCLWPWLCIGDFWTGGFTEREDSECFILLGSYADRVAGFDTQRMSRLEGYLKETKIPREDGNQLL